MHRKMFAGVGVSALFAISALAQADVLSPYIGVEFVQGGAALQSSEVAGVVPQANFNPVNVNNSTGTYGTTGNLVDAGGNTTSVSLTHQSYDGFTSDVDASTPNGLLLSGEDKSGRGTATYTFNGLAAGTYSLIAYIENDYPWSGAVNADITVGDTTYYVTDQAVSSGLPPFLLADNTNPDELQVGNYVEFENLTPVDGSITLTNMSPSGSSETAAINGLQLLTQTSPTSVPEPASLTVLALASGTLLVRRRRMQPI